MGRRGLGGCCRAWGLVVALLCGGAAPALAQNTALALPEVPARLAEGPLSKAEAAALAALLPAASAVKALALPAGKLTMPRRGQRNSLGLTVTAELEQAYDSYLSGDGRKALAALTAAAAAAGSGGGSARLAWHLSALRAQTLMMMGRAADAEVELETTARLEGPGFGWDLGARALRGEARLRLGDLAAAEADMGRVVLALGQWRLPTMFMAVPPDLPRLVVLTTAQLRAYTGLAGLYLLDGRVRLAAKWAEAAEQRFNDVHFVANHPMYAPFLPVFADSYFGRASNLAFLAAVRTVRQRSAAAGEENFAAAGRFFDSVGYHNGRVTNAALRAWALLRIEEFDGALAAADQAVDLAARQGLADLVWRIEVLRGETLLADGRAAEAEVALRRAETAVAAVSGALATDRSKLRFGVGKQDIVYRLAQFDAARGDLAALFRDLERGRARAFVDMLADRPLAAGREVALVQEIKALEAEVRRLRVINASPAGATPASRSEEARLVERRGQRIEALRQRDGELAQVFSLAVHELAVIRRGLGPGQALAYFLPARGGDRLRLLRVSAEGAEIVTLATDSAALNDLLADFTDAIALADAKLQSQTAGAIGAALAVAEWAGRTATFVVPSGALFFVPWGALEVTAPVAVLPTGGWLLRQAPSATATGSSIVGDPAYGKLMPQLPGARLEARSLGLLYGSTPLIGAAATETALRRQVGDGVGVLHLATHGLFDAAWPLQSAVVLSDGKAAVRLTAAMLFARPLPARLVVLSACDTGMGQSVAGDDFLGLARSFYLGGASAVLNSLWPVDDAGTRAYMEAFHTAARGRDYGRAWLAARDASRVQGFPPSVYGAFVLGGALRR